MSKNEIFCDKAVQESFRILTKDKAAPQKLWFAVQMHNDHKAQIPKEVLSSPAQGSQS